MGFARTLGAKAAAPGQPSGLIRRSIPQPDYAMGRPYLPMSVGSNIEKFVRDAYERSTWGFKAVHAVAHNSARLPIVKRQGNARTGKPIDGDPLATLLNSWVSQWSMEQAYVFRYRLAAQLELSVKGVFVEHVENRRGDVIHLGLLPPQNTTPIPDPLTFTAGFDVKVGNEHVTLPNDRVLWIKNPHPLDPYRSVSPAEVAGMAIDVDWLAHVYNANFMRADGRPAGVLGVKGGIDEDDAEELAAWMRGGVSRAGETRVVDADDLTFVDMTRSPRDAEYTDTVNMSKTEILMAGGVPESIAGNASGRTWDNADVEKDNFWHEKMLGVLELIGGGFDTLDGDPNTFIVHDTSEVPALQRAKNDDLNAKAMYVKQGLMAIDEWRDAAGLEKYDVPETRVPLTTMGTSPLFKVDAQGNVIDVQPPARGALPLPADQVVPPASNGTEPQPAPA